MYDDLAPIYDRFIDWPARLRREIPQLKQLLGSAKRVADVACGTGWHTTALTLEGYEAVGFDISEAALERARQVTRNAGADARFVRAGFGELAATGTGPFDAAICLGNSLPHLLAEDGLRRAADDLQQLLKPGGLFVAQLRNLPLAARRDERWLPLRTHADEDGAEWLFQRLYDFLPEHRVAFWFVIYHRSPGGAWERRIERTLLRAWTADELAAAFAGWSVSFAGDLAGTPFEPDASGDLVLLARA